MLGESEPDLGDVAIAIVNGLAALGEPVVIVIDDVQFAVDAEPSLTQVRRAATSHVSGDPGQPNRAATRAVPTSCPWAVARGARSRAPTHAGRSRCRHARVRRRADGSEVELLTTRTEGWAAGVQMAAVALRDESVPDLFLSDLAKTPRSITDFLGAEVLERQPAEILDFLLATSILEQLDAESCAAVTQRRDAGALLQQRARPTSLPDRVGTRYLPVPPSVRRLSAAATPLGGSGP